MKTFDLQRLIYDLGLKNFEFGQKIGKKRQNVSHVIKSQKLPKGWEEQIRKAFPDLDLEQYFENIPDIAANNFEKRRYYEIDTDYHNVLHVPIHAEAEFLGGENGSIQSEDLEPWMYPGLKGKCFSFVVKGDSMYPTLDPGDIIIANQQPITSLSELQNNFMYAISIDGGQILVKRIKFKDGKDKIILSSDNKMYNDQEIPENHKFIKIFKVRRIGKWNVSMRMDLL